MTATSPIEKVLSCCDGVRRSGAGWTARCPAHDDRHASLSICVGDDGRVLLKCHAGCGAEDVVERMELKFSDLFPPRLNGPLAKDPRDAIVTEGVSITQLAERLKVPESFLRELGWKNKLRHGREYIAIPYVRRDGSEGRTRKRLALSAKAGSIWGPGDEIVAYEPDRGALARQNRFVIVVEGETDTTVLLFAGFPAIGLPGCSMAKVLLAEHLEGIDVVYYVREPDRGGETLSIRLAQRLHELSYCGRLREIRLEGVKDPAELHAQAPDLFRVAFQAALDSASPVSRNALAEKSVPSHQPSHASTFTDAGNAERLVRHFGDRLRYVELQKKWYIWDGRRWALDDTSEILRLALRTVRKLYAEAAEIADPNHRSDVVTHALKSESRTRLEAMIRLASAQPEVAARVADFDQNPWLLNVQNGTVDLRTGQLQPHASEDMITKLAPVAFDAAASCPIWDATVLACMGDDAELASYLQRAVGYSLTGEVAEHCLFFCYGNGANGKGTIINRIVRLLGDYAAPGAPDLLLEKHGQAHPTEVADLHGKRLVSTPEVEQGRPWAESLIKSLTGGDPIKARRMREDFWSFEPTHKFWVSGNHKPRVRGDDDGIWRRMRLIPFVVSFKGREDRKLGEKLELEGQGILAWAVRGCLEWQRAGLADPSAVRSQTNAYRQESDSPGQFLTARCIFEKGARVPKRELRTAYQSWCDDRGENPVHFKRFAQALRAAATPHGLEPRETSVWLKGHVVDGWTDVRLATPTELQARCSGHDQVDADRDFAADAPPELPHPATIYKLPIRADGPSDRRRF